jgi:peptide chain release factor 3
MGRDFKGCYDLIRDRLILMDRIRGGAKLTDSVQCDGLDDPKLDELLGEEAAQKLRDDVEMVRGLCPVFDAEAYRAGHMTPVYFGSAVNNFGVRELLLGLAEYAPSPRPQAAVAVATAQRAGAEQSRQNMKTDKREIEPTYPKVTGFVFKVQANMDPNHRDRIAFVRLCSGHFKRGMKLFHVRSEKQIAVNNAVLFLARDRELAEDAYAGDIMGIPNHGTLRIGDTLTEGETLRFLGVPSFAPELLQRVHIGDPMKIKHLRKALEHFAEEGASQVFKPLTGAEWVVGVVGPLQFEVLAARIEAEYSLPAKFETAGIEAARWIECADAVKLKAFTDTNRASLAEDHDGALVFLARNAWHMNRTQEENPDIQFLKTREQNKLPV